MAIGRVTRKDKERVEARVSALSNEELLEETVDAAAGDDYDGAFTAVGLYEFGILQNELKQRLREIGFLKKKEGENENP